MENQNNNDSMFMCLSEVQKVNFLNERTVALKELATYYKGVKDKKMRLKAQEKCNKKIKFALQKYFDICNEVIITFNNTVVNILDNELITVERLAEKLSEKTSEEITPELAAKIEELNIKVKKDIFEVLGIKEGYEFKEITEFSGDYRLYQKVYKIITERTIQNIYDKYLDDVSDLIK
jgi:hypothetical protein